MHSDGKVDLSRRCANNHYHSDPNLKILYFRQSTNALTCEPFVPIPYFKDVKENDVISRDSTKRTMSHNVPFIRYK